MYQLVLPNGRTLSTSTNQIVKLMSMQFMKHNNLHPICSGYREYAFTIVEAVTASLILSLLIIFSSRFWNTSTDSMLITSMRAKVDAGIARRMEEIRHCSRFYEIKAQSLENPGNLTEATLLSQDCRAQRIDRTVETSYNEDATRCKNSTLGQGLKDYLDSNASKFLTSLTLSVDDSGLEPISIEVNATPDGNTLNVELNADFRSTTISKSTSILPNAQSWCAYPYTP